MKTVSQVQNTGKNQHKNRKRKSHDHHDSHQKKSKYSNDPLYAGGNNNTNNNGGGEGGLLFQSGESSGRKEWKMKHRKGEFNPKLQKAKSYQTPGTFQKSKKKLARIANN